MEKARTAASATATAADATTTYVFVLASATFVALALREELAWRHIRSTRRRLLQPSIVLPIGP